LDRAVLAAYAAIDPAGGWVEDWAEVWIETGAGQPPPVEHPLRAKRVVVDQLVLANLLRLNHERAGTKPSEVSPETNTAVAPHAHRLLGDPKLAKALGEYRDGLREIYDARPAAKASSDSLDGPKKCPRLERVVLFGSRARGTATPGSDADVLIVLNGKFDPDKELQRTSQLTTDVSLRHGVMINRIVMNKKQADSRNGPLQDNTRRDSLIL
jgi:predicted nucleotidyltransferase